MYTADIYLTWERRWLFRYPLPALSELQAQRLAEAIALCHGASLTHPHTAVFALRQVQFEKGAIAA